MKKLSIAGLGVLAFAAATLAPSVASAHISLTYPPARSTSQKSGPCGKGAADPRGTKITYFKPGQKVTVTWDETIDHPGHYRISFDDDGQDIFTDPSSFTDVAPRAGVLVDDIKDVAGGSGKYSQEITLPNKECNNCTLQVVQVMTDKPPYGDGNDLYYQCADIVLTNNPPDGGASSSSSSSGATSSSSSGGSSGSDAGATSSSGGAPADDGGCSTSGQPEGALLPIAAAAMIAALRRRRAPRA
ncbi:MAG: lytic polysaccharide monooxygenase [Myxococcales bacterium]|nr:lytic polysaccharide monooxygenase [Myxococcales bacterium]